ncbi:MAG: ADP-heptose--LPS heptosyltransferase [Alphaproteobacteria bacterium]|nr:ADP-heptose--LPS heptosyltransferase [Alphaproteobacteria bacterium]
MTNYDDLIAAGRGKLWEGRCAEARACFEAVLDDCPEEAAAHYLCGEAYFLERRLDEALACHAAALNRGMDRDIAARGRAMSGMIPGDFGWMSHMLRGDFESAWQLGDRDQALCRQNLSVSSLPRHMRALWDGSPLDGRRVLVRCYHGLGDTIHFIRYAPLLAHRAASVRVEAQPQLLQLLSGLSGIDGLHALTEDHDRDCSEFGCDAEIDVTELPHAFRTTLDTIPAEVPYLWPKPGHMAAARRRLAVLQGRRKVGLCWAAGAWRPERSVAAAALAPLSDCEGVAFACLQRGPAFESWRTAPNGPLIAEVLTSDSIDETAAVIANLDLVITVDTMVAHLAGALGVPVWVLLHSAADWRWLLDRDDSPWYPRMRLFRQPSSGDWQSAIAAVAAALCAWTPD